MRRSRNIPTAAITLALTAVAAAGCGPIRFQGSNAKVIGPSGPSEPPPVSAEKPRVEVTDNAIVINEKIQFDYNKAVIRPVSFDLLKEVAKVMNDNPRIKKIRVEGHTCNMGSFEYNQNLSERRAAAVVDHLVRRGKVKKERLVPQGYSFSRPIADNSTEEGKEKNRRVEFIILEQEVEETRTITDPNTGETKTETVKTTRTAN